MQEEIKDLIINMAQGNAAESETLLNTVMAQKVASALDNLRVNVAQSMFKAQEE